METICETSQVPAMRQRLQALMQIVFGELAERVKSIMDFCGDIKNNEVVQLSMNAKEFLRQIKKLDKLIENKMAEVQQWKEIATNISPNMTGERVQSSGNPHKIADAIGRYIDLEREINQDIDKLVEAKKDVINVIEQLNATEYDVLHKVYVQGFTFDEVAIACKHTTSWATTVHGRALKHVQIILDQKKD